MMRHRRAPAVEHGGDADPGANPLGIGGDRQRGLSRRRKQQTVDRGFVVVGDIGDRTRQREHEVEVADGQQFGLALGEPFLGGSGLTLGAMPVAAGNGHRPLPALWANFVMVSRQAAPPGLTWDSGSLALHYDLSLSRA